MPDLELQLENAWLQDNRVLSYTVYSLNNKTLKAWAYDVIEQLANWPSQHSPRLLFDLSNPNVSMSYFVLTRRNIFNLALTPETRQPLDDFIAAHPNLRVRLALILSQTMAGVMTGHRGTNVLRQLTIGKVFFERDSAMRWLLADTSGSGDVGTRHMDNQELLKDLDLDSIPGSIFRGGSEMRLLVNGSLEIVPLSEARPIIIGRSSSADIDVSSHGEPAITVSRQHAQLSLVNGMLSIMDLNSKNGTFVDGQQIEPGKPIPVTATSDMRVGAITLRVLA